MCVIILQMVWDGIYTMLWPTHELAHGFKIAIFTFDNGAYTNQKVNVKVLHISSMNIHKIVRNWANITITIKFEVAYGLLLTYLHLMLINNKEKIEGNAYFDSGYIASDAVQVAFVTTHNDIGKRFQYNTRCLSTLDALPTPLVINSVAAMVVGYGVLSRQW